MPRTYAGISTYDDELLGCGIAMPSALRPSRCNAIAPLPEHQFFEHRNPRSGPSFVRAKRTVVVKPDPDRDRNIVDAVDRAHEEPDDGAAASSKFCMPLYRCEQILPAVCALVSVTPLRRDPLSAQMPGSSNRRDR